MNNHMVLDVSSNEEGDYKRENFSEWLEEFLQASESDEKLKRCNLSDPTVEIKDEDDDDCVILDCDPMANQTVIDTVETDQVLVVTGQKGEIACRDFPHPRHDCAKYSFKSTLHQHYCEMCYCYVCDTRAPCPYWYSGFSSVDHCHANDKEEIWKRQREWIRSTGNMLSRPVSTLASTIPQMGRVTRPLSLLTSPITQFGVRPCSTSTKVAAHPHTFTRPCYRTERSGAFLMYPVSQAPATHSYPNHRDDYYSVVPSPKKAVSSSPYTYRRPSTHRRPSRRVYHPVTGGHNIAQGSQATRYTHPAASQATRTTPLPVLQATRTASTTASLATCCATPEASQPRCNAPPVASQAARNAPPAAAQPTRSAPLAVSQATRIAQHMASQSTRNAPPVASQGNPQRIVTGYFSTVPESPSKVYARQFNQKMYSANLQTNAVPCEFPNPRANQRQHQSGRSNDKVLSEIEDWLLDDSTPADRLCPLFG